MKKHVLDHGYVELIEAWGTGRDGIGQHPDDGRGWDYEVGIVEAARQSTQGTFRGWGVDGKLLGTLYNSEPKHATPFEFAGMVVEVQAPIGVFREWHRHRTQSYNEMSARYAALPDLYYLPESEAVVRRARAAAETKNRQAAAVAQLDEEKVREWVRRLDAFYAQAEELYWSALQAGVPKELARWSMPVGHYSRMRAAGNLRNWLGFLTLRTDRRAMEEMRLFAVAVEEVVKATFPHTYDMWLAEKMVNEGMYT